VNAHRGDIEEISWKMMEAWLQGRLADESTRALEAVSRLRRLEQRENQSFDKFVDVFEAAEGELPFELPVMFCVSFFLSSLCPEIRRGIVTQGIPEM
jgi:hypothetical protein